MGRNRRSDDALIYVFLLFAILAVLSKQSENNSQASVLSVGFLSVRDKAALKKIFDSYTNDAQSLFYAAMGHKVLGETFKGAKDACKEFDRASKSADLEQVYFGVLGSELLKETCGKIAVPEFAKMWDAKMNAQASSETILHLVSIAKVLKTTVDVSKVLPALKSIKTEAGTVTNLSNIFAILSQLDLSKADLQSFEADVKRMISQADEADGKYLYFEKGTFTTASVVSGLFKFARLLGKMPDVTEHQIIKLANTLYSRRRTGNIRSAAQLIAALDAVSTNEFMVPVVVSGVSEHHVIGASGIEVRDSKKVVLKLTNIFGEPLDTQLDLSAAGLYKNGVLDGAANRGSFKSQGKGSFVIDLGTLSQGEYHLEIAAKLKNAEAKLPNYVGVSSVRVPLRILSTVGVENGTLTVATSVPSRVVSDIALSLGKKAVLPENIITNDFNFILLQSGQNARLNFQLTDSATKSALDPQQVFVQFTHKTSKVAVTYVITPTSPGSYSFKLSVNGAADDFKFLSGVYSMELIVGDALLANSFNWAIADFDIHFPASDYAAAADKEKTEHDVSQLSVKSGAGEKRSHPLIGQGPTKAKPDLSHTFRKPEPRPSSMVSLTFTGLCLSPFLVLLIAWLVIGANLRNFQFSLSSFVFHGGLTCIFGLYICYWVHLDMFTTLRYLSVIGLVTFLAGHRLLRHMSSLRK